MANQKGLTFRKKGDVVTVRIKVGKQWVERSEGWRTIKEATEAGMALRDKLQAEYAAAHPELVVQKVSGNSDELKPRRGEKSLRERAEEARLKYCKRQRLRDEKNGISAFNWLWEQLDDKADLPPRLQRIPYFTKVRNAFLDGHLAQRTVELYSKTIRSVLRHIPDMDAACLAELEHMPRKESTQEASGAAFQPVHFKVMFTHLAEVDETTQILFWIGASGGPQIVDTVFLPFRAIEWDSGLVRYFRVKTGEMIEFKALPPLQELLRKRRERLGADAVYVLPEVIFKKQDMKDPECNIRDWKEFKGWDMKKPPKDAVDRGAVNGIKIMNVFLDRCGIKTEDLTHKSFRKHCISFWASIGIKLKTRMRMAGHSKESSHYRYDVPAAFEIGRAADITWQYYQAIMKGEDFFIPTTTFDMYQAIIAQWSKFPELLKAMLCDQFTSLHAFLREAFVKQCAYAEEQTKLLRADYAKLQEQVTALQHGCDKLSKHFGLS